MALGAVALAAGITASLALAVEGPARSWTLVLGLAAVVLLAAGLAVSRPPAIPAAIFLLGAAYAIRLLAGEETLHEGAPLVAAGLFALAELAYWSLELRGGVADEPGAHLRRIGLLAGLTLGVLALGVALLSLADVVRTGGIAVEVLGAAAAVAALSLLALSSRRLS